MSLGNLSHLIVFSSTIVFSSYSKSCSILLLGHCYICSSFAYHITISCLLIVCHDNAYEWDIIKCLAYPLVDLDFSCTSSFHISQTLSWIDIIKWLAYPLVDLDFSCTSSFHTAHTLSWILILKRYTSKYRTKVYCTKSLLLHANLRDRTSLSGWHNLVGT